MFKSKKAFTLVELIVVITILTILGTIAFISLQGYSKTARDSVRISDISNIEKQLELFLLKSGTLPIPEDNIELVSSGVTIGYQGYVGKKTLELIGLYNGGKDPLDDAYYTYRINSHANAYQILGFTEDGTEIIGIFPRSYAAENLINRYPMTKGKVLGILLEYTTNNPLQELETGAVDIRANTRLVNMYLLNTSKKTGTLQELYGIIETLDKNQNFYEPEECISGFIKVPGNEDLGQPSFCVAKYEMTYADGADTPNSTGGGTDRNTVSYTGSKIPVSMPGKYPVTDITQLQAINACKSIGEGYHLITNNERMTIARNIELQPINWSGGVVGQNFIYNGVSNNLTMGCNIDLTGTTGRRWATKTGDTNCTDLRNKLVLSNGEEIWDLSGNVVENVNGANTLDGTNYDTMQAQVCGRTDSTNARNSFYGNDGYVECEFSNSYTYANIGPLTSGLNGNNGIGRVKDYGGNSTDRVFRRGATSTASYGTGVFALISTNNSSAQDRGAGFRCAR